MRHLSGFLQRLAREIAGFRARRGPARRSQTGQTSAQFAAAPTPRKPTMAFSIDPQTLQDAARGDAAALASLVKTLRPVVEKQLLRYPLTDEDRRDLLQSTLVQIIRRVGSFRGDSSFSTWLFRVTANEALMMMRSQRRHRARLGATESAVRSRLHRARSRLRAILERSPLGDEIAAA